VNPADAIDPQSVRVEVASIPHVESTPGHEPPGVPVVVVRAAEPPRAARLPTSMRRSTTAAAPAALPDPVALIEEHLVPVLLKRSLIDGAESTEVVRSSSVPRRPPAPGHARVVVGEVQVERRIRPAASPRRVSASDGDAADAGATRRADADPASPEVHLHIGRIEVARTLRAVPPPAPSRPAAPAVDHSQYLARRRGER
jgi:hypothetical protein